MGSINMDNYADSVTFIYRDSVEKHITAGCLHDWAKKIYSGCSYCFASSFTVVRLI